MKREVREMMMMRIGGGGRSLKEIEMHAFRFLFCCFDMREEEGPFVFSFFYYSFFLLFQRLIRKELQPYGCFLFIHIDATNVHREIKGERESQIFRK